MLIIVNIIVNNLDLDSVIQCLYLINNLQESTSYIAWQPRGQCIKKIVNVPHRDTPPNSRVLKLHKRLTKYTVCITICLPGYYHNRFIGRLLLPDIVQFHFACLGTAIFLRELTR